MRMELLLFLALAVLVDPAASVVGKCFSCRSSGPLGDCHDPFYLSDNATIIESKKSSMETPPCSSGWCLKMIEGRENREERKECLQRLVRTDYIFVFADNTDNNKLTIWSNVSQRLKCQISITGCVISPSPPRPGMIFTQSRGNNNDANVNSAT